MKNIKIVIAFLIVVIGMLIYPFKKIAVMPQESYLGNSEFIATGEVDANHTLEQSFMSQGDSLKCLSVYIQNSANSEKASVLLKIVDENETIVCEREYAAKNIPSYEWMDLTVNAKLEKNKLYRIIIELKDMQDGHIQFFSIESAEGARENIDFLYNGTKQSGTISFVYKYMNCINKVGEAVPFGVILFVLYIAITTVLESIFKRYQND